jgi:hypothetical protein
MAIRSPTLAGQVAMQKRLHAGERLDEAEAKGDRALIEYWQAEIARLDRLVVREGGDPPL